MLEVGRQGVTGCLGWGVGRGEELGGGPWVMVICRQFGVSKKVSKQVSQCYLQVDCERQ